MILFTAKNVDFYAVFASVTHDARPETEVELEAGTFDYHELESDVASQQGCYSPVSSASDMEPSADHGIGALSTRLMILKNNKAVCIRWLLGVYHVGLVV